MFKPNEWRANDPLVSLAVRFVLGLVVEVECFSDDFCFGHVVFVAFVLHPIKSVLGEANGERWVFGHRALYRHDSQMLLS